MKIGLLWHADERNAASGSGCFFSLISVSAVADELPKEGCLIRKQCKVVTIKQEQRAGTLGSMIYTCIYKVWFRSFHI